MKRSFYIIDPTISGQENLKKLVNHNFQKEISLDILRGKPPDYYDSLRINTIRFTFTGQSKYEVEDSDRIYYLQLNVELNKGRKRRYDGFTGGVKKKSIKVHLMAIPLSTTGKDQEIIRKVDINYLKKIFYQFKNLKEEDEAACLLKQERENEISRKLSEIRSRNNIKSGNVYLYGGSIQNIFQLSFNKLTEDEVDYLMSCWNKINNN